MKFLVLLSLSAALLVAGCGEKLSSEGSDSTGESAEASPEAAQQSEEPLTLPLSDADVERLLKEAVELEPLEVRGRLFYLNDEPFSGWAKEMYDSGQAEGLMQFKDGKPDGLAIFWRENGQKKGGGFYKDGELISGKFWNSKGEEVETEEEAAK